MNTFEPNFMDKFGKEEWDCISRAVEKGYNCKTKGNRKMVKDNTGRTIVAYTHFDGNTMQVIDNLKNLEA